MKPYINYLIQVYTSLVVLIGIAIYGAHVFVAEFFVSSDTVLNMLK